MKKNFYIPLFITVGCAILFAILSTFNVFQKLDYRIYDGMSHLKKEPPANENIVIVKADDESIEKLGEWPWSRDVLADVLIRLKEFDSRFAVFDIEYISPSKNGIAPSAELNITNQVAGLRDSVLDLGSQMLSTGIRNYSSDELWQMYYETNVSTFNDLTDYIKHNMSRDNDEYFARAIQFFGHSWLTVNHMNLGIQTSQEDIDYIYNRLLLSDITDNGKTIHADNVQTAKEQDEEISFTPALHSLIARSEGVSFTNSVIDSDGTRRRMELLFEYNGKYLPQLSFGPLLSVYQTNKLERTKKSVIIKDAVDPDTGIVSDIKIPVDGLGRIVINWRQKQLDEQFKTEPIYNIYQLDELENDILTCLKNILIDKQIEGPDLFMLPYYYETQELVELYTQLLEFKSYLLSKCNGYDENNNLIDGITDEEYAEYFGGRRQFFEMLSSFIGKGYYDVIMNRIEEKVQEGSWDGTEEDIIYFEEDFTRLNQGYEWYSKYYDELSKKFKNAYCIIGNTATSTTDLGAMPFNKKFENVGIHANVINTILTKDFINPVDWYWGYFIAVIAFIIMLLFREKTNTFQNILNGSVMVIIILVYIFTFIFTDYYIPFFGSAMFMFTDFVGLIAFRFAISNREKKFITQIASSFANKDTVEQLRKNPEMFTTTGQKKCITALFTDIQKFSTFSESITKIYQDDGANQLIRHLNDYLGAMSDEILKNNGNIDKYEGDAIISMFGAPDPMNLHNGSEWAYYALDSAIRMKQVEKEFNESHQDLFRRYTPEEFPHLKEDVILNPFKTRIGINTGEAFVGLMGSKTESFSKLNYTMIGDTVNLAARLEGVNKAYSSWILCSGDTWEMANSGENEGKILARRLDQVRVVGRSTPVQLYNIVGFTNELSLEQREEIDIFHAGLDKYLERDFVNAGKLFMQATSTGIQDDTAIIFAQRCKDFIEKGVPEGWDGVINMTSK